MAEEPLQQILSQLPLPLFLITKQLATVATQIFHLTTPLVAAALHPSSSSGSSISPELLNAALLLFIVYISLQILSLASRWMYSMVITTIRMGIIVMFMAVGMSIWSRGFGATKSNLWEIVDNVANSRMVNEQLEKLNQAAGGGGAAYNSRRGI